MRKNKILCLILSLALLLPLIPTFAITSDAATLTEAEFSAKIEELKKEYPDGKYWNSYNGTDSKGNSKAGSNKGICGGSTCAVDCPCTCGYYKDVGYQCFGFANLMAYKVFGSYATTTSEGSRGNNTKAGWRRFEHSDKSDYTYSAGDFVQVQKYGHSIFIIKVEGDYVYYVDCNWSGPCKIEWDNKMTLKDMQNWTSYVLHMEGNTLTGSGKTANRLSIQYDANGGSIESTKYTINTAGLRFRENASTDSAVLINEIPKGTEIIALEMKNSGGYLWAKAKYNDKIGWCAIYSESESEWYADKTGFYVVSDIIYQHRTQNPHVQTWFCGTEADLYNNTTFQLVRENHVFKGWSLSPYGGELLNQDTKYLPESIVPSLVDGDQTLMVYAIWEDTTPYQITFNYNANGGSGTVASQVMQKGETLAIINNSFKKKDSSFVGWMLRREDGKWFSENETWEEEDILLQNGTEKKVFSEGETIAITSPLVALSGDHSYTFYAMWKNNSIQNICLTSIEKELYYRVGDSLYTGSQTLMVQYKEGTCETVEEGFTCSPTFFDREGTQTVTVSYQGHETTFDVQVTEEKQHRVNGYAKEAATGYLLPDDSSATIADQGSYETDELQVLCYENGFNLVFIPWGSSTLTEENRVLMYLPSGTVGSSEDIDGPAECYSMNPTRENNGKIIADTEVYHRPDFGENAVIFSGKNYTVIDTLKSETRVKVLFEMNGHYCIQTDSYTGFVPNYNVAIDKKVCGIYVNSAFSDFTLQAVQGGEIDTSSLEIAAVYSNNGSSLVTDYEIDLPKTDEIGIRYAVISYEGFKTYIKININAPRPVGVSIETPPVKTRYFVGETADLTGLTLKVIYENGTFEIIDSGFSVGHFDSDSVGEKEITVSFGDYECSFTVSVIAKTLAGDLNDDGALTSEDAIYLLYYTLFGSERYSLNQSADFDKDGAVTSADAIYLLYSSLFGSDRYPV